MDLFSPFFAVKVRKYLWRKLELPLLKSCDATLQEVSVQLCSFTAQLIQFEAMQRRLITVNVHEWCYFFVCLHGLIYNVCLNCLTLTHAYFEPCTPLVNGCINYALFNVVPNVYLQSWKEWVMHQTKFQNMVIRVVLKNQIKLFPCAFKFSGALWRKNNAHRISRNLRSIYHCHMSPVSASWSAFTKC